MSLLKILGSTSFLMANKEIVKATDLECAVLLSDLAGAYDYWNDRGLLENGYFYRTQKDIESNTMLSPKVQLRCLKVLISKGIINTKLKGTPPVKYFYLDVIAINTIISQKVEIEFYQMDKLNSTNGRNYNLQMVENELAQREILISTKGRTNNNRVNNNKEYKIDNNNREYSEKQVFAPTPKIEIEDLKFYFETTQVCELLTERTGAKYNFPKTSDKFKKYGPYKFIKSLLEDGRTLEDIFLVIECKCRDWLSDAKMCSYLTPATLLKKSNFEKYLIGSQIKTSNNVNNGNNEREKFADFIKQVKNFDL